MAARPAVNHWRPHQNEFADAFIQRLAPSRVDQGRGPARIGGSFSRLDPWLAVGDLWASRHARRLYGDFFPCDRGSGVCQGRRHRRLRFVNLYRIDCLQFVQRARLSRARALARTCGRHQKVHFPERNLGLDGDDPRRRLRRDKLRRSPRFRAGADLAAAAGEFGFARGRRAVPFVAAWNSAGFSWRLDRLPAMSRIS